MSKKKKVETTKKTKKYISATGACYMATIATIFNLGLSIYLDYNYGAYGSKNVPTAIALCIITSILTFWSRNRDKKHEGEDFIG